MSRPAQLEAQMQRVKEIQDEMLGNTPPAPDAPVEPINSQEPTTSTPPAQEPPVTVSKEDYDKLDQRNRTLQGMYNADTVRYRNEIANLNNALQDMEDRLVIAEQAQRTTPVIPNKYVTEDDEKTYGETVDMVRRAAREETEAALAKQEAAYLNRIAQLEQQVNQVQNTVVPKINDLQQRAVDQVKSEFWAAIETQIPDWRTINDTRAFKEWLTEVDPLTGSTRQQFLAQAQREYNALRVIKFFQEWKRMAAGGQTPAPNTTQSQLEKLVAPGASKNGGGTANLEKKQWTGADVSRFYQDVTKGVYANKPDERKQIEADIYAAQREGRYKY